MSAPVSCGSDYVAELILYDFGRGRASIADLAWLDRMAATAPPAPPKAASSAPPRADPSEVELRSELPATPHRVHLSEGTVTAIEAEIHAAFQDFGRLVETGGALQGIYRTKLWPPESRVVRATGPGPSAEHSRTSMRWLPNEVLDPEMFELGCWHTHPAANPTPSRADLECWRDGIGHSRQLAYVGVIATPRDDGTGWMSPELTAYVVRRGYQTGPFCEPALIID